METKSYHNLQKRRISNFFTGFCIISGLTLAAFSYGNVTTIYEKETDIKLSNDIYLSDIKEKHLDIRKKELVSYPKETQVKNPILDLQQEINSVDNNNTNETNDVKLEGQKSDSNYIIQENNITENQIIIDFPDVEPDFPGGYQKWSSWLSDNFKYPDLDLELGNQGIVYVSFVVEVDGSITNIEIIKSVSRGIDSEAKRLIKNSPKWIAGKVGNKEVRTRLKLPINFVIN